MQPIVQAAVSLFGASLGYTSGSTSAAATGSAQNAAALPGVMPGVTNPMAASGVPPAPFADLLTDTVGEVDRLEVQARAAVEGLMSGRGVDVHEAMIATENADAGFELVLAVRNKALAAYQQVMGMQF